MKIGILGRTQWLLDAAESLLTRGHEIVFVVTNNTVSDKPLNAEFEKLATQAACPFFIANRVEQIADDVIPLAADVCISVNFINIIPLSFIDLFPCGVLNAHAGDLPRYRGNACPNWAILNDEPHVGLCIHQMDESLDSGPIYVKDYFALDDDVYIGDVYRWLAVSIPVLFGQAITKIENRQLPTPQDPKVRPLRVFPRKPEDSEIDWKLNKNAILKLIRASSHPFSGAFSYLNGAQKVTIFRANEYSLDYDVCAIPGQVCFSDNESIVIACADGLIQIREYRVDNHVQKVSFNMICSSFRSRLTGKRP